MNQNLYQKVCDVTCSDKELTELSATLSSTEFDLNHPFEKYYSLATITKAINKYLSGEITDTYLSQWMNAYNWLISANTQTEPNDEKYTLQEYLQFEISNTLDTLSFFTESEFEDTNKTTPDFLKNPKAYLNNCLAAFKYYDMIYQNLSNFEIYYQIITEKGQDPVLEFLCVDTHSKTYLFFDESKIYTKGDQVDGTQLTAAKLSAKIKDLKESGYQLIDPTFEEFN